MARLLEVNNRRKIATVIKRDDRTAQAQQGLTIINNISTGVGQQKDAPEVQRSSPVNWNGDVDKALVDYIEHWC